MLLRNRLPVLEDSPVPSAKAFEQMDDSAIAIVRWLNANRVDYVVTGAIARIARGDSSARGPLTVVPAPYGRNLDRLARALNSARARVRLHGELSGPGVDPFGPPSAPIKLHADRFVGAERLTLRCGSHDLDVEARPTGVPRYQELLYEAAKVELADGVVAECAGLEHIEHYEHLRRAGVAPEIRVTRAVPSPSA
jgi:hypothetical protein